MSSEQSSLGDHGSGGDVSRERRRLPDSAPTDPVIRSVPEPMRDPDPPAMLRNREHLIPVAVHNHDAVCSACSRYITITPDGVEVGHYREKSDAVSSCPHRPSGRDPSIGGRS